MARCRRWCVYVRVLKVVCAVAALSSAGSVHAYKMYGRQQEQPSCPVQPCAGMRGNGVASVKQEKAC